VMTDRSTCARLYAAVARRSMASTFCGCCSITLSSSASYIHITMPRPLSEETKGCVGYI
jgi:hypothetical protein